MANIIDIESIKDRWEVTRLGDSNLIHINKVGTTDTVCIDIDTISSVYKGKDTKDNFFPDDGKITYSVVIYNKCDVSFHVSSEYESSINSVFKDVYNILENLGLLRNFIRIDNIWYNLEYIVNTDIHYNKDIKKYETRLFFSNTLGETKLHATYEEAKELFTYIVDSWMSYKNRINEKA